MQSALRLVKGKEGERNTTLALKMKHKKALQCKL